MSRYEKSTAALFALLSLANTAQAGKAVVENSAAAGAFAFGAAVTVGFVMIVDAVVRRVGQAIDEHTK